MIDVTFDKLRAMVRADDDTSRGMVDPAVRQGNWDLYAGENCFTPEELESFRNVKVIPFALNRIAPIIDGYVATLDPLSLEPVIDAQDAASEPLLDLANAFLLKSRKASRVANVEEQVPLHFMVSSVAASMCTVVSDNGRTRHRVEMLRPEEIRWDSRAVEPNAEDALWFARISTYNLRELKLNLPRVWQKVKKGRDEREVETLLTTSETLFCNAEQSGRRSYIEVVTFEWKELRSYLMIPSAMLTEYDLAAAQEHVFEVTVDGLRLESDEVDQFVEWMENYDQDPGLDRAQNWQGEAFYYAVVVGNEVVESGQLDEGCFRIQLCCGPEISISANRVKYRSIAGDLAAPQKLINHNLTSQLTTLSKVSRGVHLVAKSNTDIPELMRQFSTPGAVIPIDSPEDYKGIAPDVSVLDPAMAVLQIAREAMDERMGTSSLSRGGLESGDKVTRTSSKTVETLLERADAPVKAYYARYMRWRTALAKCMVQQITHWDFEELTQLLGPGIVEPVAQVYGSLGSVPSGALWEVSIDLREPQKRQKAQVAADVLGQGLLPQLVQLGLPMPPDILMELVLPLFSLSEIQVDRWKAFLTEQQQQAAMQPPPEEGVPN